tara:strand:+ start:194 stop:907 length:714 start_codon:yes stop_codon:yes gene_type:complete
MNYKKTVGITGASGAFGKALTKQFKSNGYEVIGLTHSEPSNSISEEEPNKWIYWECGKEFLLEEVLARIDILVLNHGIYDKNPQQNIEKSIEINATSKLKILNLYEKISLSISNKSIPREIWVNTSEAEILPALNPTYEISKSLIGQSITLKKNFHTQFQSEKLIIKKIILGPFKSKLNPIGLIPPEFVAFLVFNISKFSNYLIIVSPNPLSYLLFPIKEFYFYLYYSFLKIFMKNN